jgi:hypothetical protein
VRNAAIRTLGAWNNAEAAPDLLELARNCPDPAEKTLSLRSYIGLARQTELSAESRLTICREASGLVQQPDEKKLLLGVLGSIPSAGSLKLIEPFLEDSSLKEEASAACVAVAEKLLQSTDSPKIAPQLIAPLQKAVSANAGSESAKRAQSMLEQAQKKAGEVK